MFLHVTLPLARPGILAGAVFAFATSLDEVVVTLFVAGPNQTTPARQMFSSLRGNIGPAIAAAACLMMPLLAPVEGAALAGFMRRRRGRA